MNEKSKPREGTVESKVEKQLDEELAFHKSREGQEAALEKEADARKIIARYSLQELCDFVFAKANEKGERIKIGIKPPAPVTKKGKKNKGKGKKKP